MSAMSVENEQTNHKLYDESTKTTVDRYGHLMPGAGDLAAEAMGRVFGGITGAPLSGELLPPTGADRQ